MSLHLLSIFTGQGDISKVLIMSQVFKWGCNVLFEVVPLQTELLWHRASFRRNYHKTERYYHNSIDHICTSHFRKIKSTQGEEGEVGRFYTYFCLDYSFPIVSNWSAVSFCYLHVFSPLQHSKPQWSWSIVFQKERKQKVVHSKKGMALV